MEMRSSLAMGQDWDFRVVVPSCVLFHLTDNLIDDFITSCSPVLQPGLKLGSAAYCKASDGMPQNTAMSESS